MDERALLSVLQLADSAFPSGAYTLSHGLEQLAADGVVHDASGVEAALRVSLLERLGRSDLVALLAAHRASDPDEVAAIDQRLSATKLAAEDRAGSGRVGRRLLAEAARIEVQPHILRPGAMTTSHTLNAAVALGLVYAAFGVPARAAAIAAAWSFASGFCSAAVRLGLIGHGDAQQILRDAGPTILGAVDRASDTDVSEMRPSAPQLEVALARHETASARLFAS